MPPRAVDRTRYEYGEGIRQACGAIVQRMDEGESWVDALNEDMDPKAHSEMTPTWRMGFLGVFEQLQHVADYEGMT